MVGMWCVLGALGFFKMEANDGGFLSGIGHNVGHARCGPKKVEVVHVGGRLTLREMMADPYEDGLQCYTEEKGTEGVALTNSCGALADYGAVA
jgi:hypothetical protein